MLHLNIKVSLLKGLKTIFKKENLKENLKENFSSLQNPKNNIENRSICCHRNEFCIYPIAELIDVCYVLIQF